MDEKWKSVFGFSGLYEVSNLGRVRSLRGRHGTGAMLNPKLPENPRQYMAVSLHDGSGIRLRRHVHSLVAMAFLPERPSREHEVRHLDGDRGNNAATNLRWGTRKENADDRARHGRTAVGERHGAWRHGQHKAGRHLSTNRRRLAIEAALRARSHTAPQEK